VNVNMIDQSLAQARALIGAPGGVAPPAREKFTAADGRTFTKVPAKEWRRLLNESMPRVNLVLVTADEALAPNDVLTVTFTLSHAWGDTRTLTRAEPLPPAPSKSLAKQWAHTRAVNAVARTLLWQWDDEDEDETEGQKPAEQRTQRQVQEDERRESKGLEPYHRNGSGRSTKASRATAALADAMSESPVAVELGDEEREKEAAMDLEAKRLAALPSSLPPVKDPDWLEDEPKAQTHQKPLLAICCGQPGDAHSEAECERRNTQPASPPVATPTGSMDGDEGEVTPDSPSVLTGGATPQPAPLPSVPRAETGATPLADASSVGAPSPDAAAPASSPLPEASSSPALSGGDINSPSVLVVRNNQGGLPPGAPLGGECGAVVEPPASEDCPSGAGAPPASDEEDPDAWRSRVSPEVAARYDALDAADNEPLHPRVGESAEDDDEIAARNGCSCERCNERRAAELPASLRERVEALGYVLHADGTKGRMKVTQEDADGDRVEVLLVNATAEHVETFLRTVEAADAATPKTPEELAAFARKRQAEILADEQPSRLIEDTDGPLPHPDDLPEGAPLSEPAWPGDTPTPAEDVQREQPKPTPAQRLAAAMLDDPSDPEPVKPEQVASLAAGIAAAEPSLGASSFVAWLKKSTTPGPIEQAATVQGRKDRAALWALCKLRKANGNGGPWTCAECGEAIETEEYREGLDETKVPKKGRRSNKPSGRCHEDCRLVLAEGRDPREEGEVSA
jgi:hypothetical protein